MRIVTIHTEPQPQLGFLLDGQAYTFPAAAQALGGWESLHMSPKRPQASGHSESSGYPEPFQYQDILSFLAAGEAVWRQANELIGRFQTLPESTRNAVRALDPLLAPIPRPRKNIICVGRNYLEHAKERGADAPPHPVFFTKAPTTVSSPQGRIPYPPETSQFDFEGELAVVIGRRGRNIPAEQAYDYVFGYTIVNDLTARDIQKQHQQWFRGKSFDYTCPMGPAIVTRDELGPPDQLTVETRVNGELRQSGHTSQMIYDIPTLLAILSTGMTLEPGDVIATGTPSGVGAADGRFLSSGDHVEVTISGIGTLGVTIEEQPQT